MCVKPEPRHSDECCSDELSDDELEDACEDACSQYSSALDDIGTRQH